MPYSTTSSLGRRTRSSAYFLFWSFQIFQEFSLVDFSLYKLTRIDEKQHPCLTLPPLLALLASPWCLYVLAWKPTNMSEMIQVRKVSSVGLCKKFNITICITNSVYIPYAKFIVHTFKNPHRRRTGNCFLSKYVYYRSERIFTVCPKYYYICTKFFIYL
jgi:hypothetical protein